MKTLVHPTCPYCSLAVIPGQPFDMWREVWSGDFIGDSAGDKMVVAHRTCNPDANHSKD